MGRKRGLPRIAPGELFVRTNRAHRGSDRFAWNQDAIAGRDDASDGFAGGRISVERGVIDALYDLELSKRLGGIRCFVSVSRHRAIQASQFRL